MFNNHQHCVANLSTDPQGNRNEDRSGTPCSPGRLVRGCARSAQFRVPRISERLTPSHAPPRVRWPGASAPYANRSCSPAKRQILGRSLIVATIVRKFRWILPPPERQLVRPNRHFAVVTPCAPSERELLCAMRSQLTADGPCP